MGQLLFLLCPSVLAPWLSDSSVLSDNHWTRRGIVGRFLRIIGQPTDQTQADCPILPHYRTTSCIPLSVASITKRLHQNDATSVSCLYGCSFHRERKHDHQHYKGQQTGDEGP